MRVNTIKVMMGCESMCVGKMKRRKMLKHISHETEYFEDITETLQ